MASRIANASLRINGQDVPLVEPSCKKCLHLMVCVIYRSNFEAMKENFPDLNLAPFKPDELAKICKYYSDAPRFSSDTLTA